MKPNECPDHPGRMAIRVNYEKANAKRWRITERCFYCDRVLSRRLVRVADVERGTRELLTGAR